MQKIRLGPENLRVDTFAVTPEPRRGDGTVLAHSATYTSPTYPDPPTCDHTVCDCMPAVPPPPREYTA